MKIKVLLIIANCKRIIDTLVDENLKSLDRLVYNIRLSSELKSKIHESRRDTVKSKKSTYKRNKK